MKNLFITLNILCTYIAGISQEVNNSQFHAAYKSYQLIDSSRTYKPGSDKAERLHFRPVQVDVWYPSDKKSTEVLSFGELLSAYEKNASRYQEDDYTGLTNELAKQIIANATSKTISVKQLLNKRTDSYKGLPFLYSKSPLIIYMAGQNGASFENYPIFEHLARHGYTVASIWSVGRYPGYMSNSLEDMMEQVYDAEFVIKELVGTEAMEIDTTNVGIIGYSWGGLGAAALTARHPKIKAVLSLDGTETYYFGNSAEEDEKLRSIHNSNILHPKTNKSSYFYLESGNKLNGFEPLDKYDYYEQKEGEKQYTRFINSTHEDFSCLPFLLNTSTQSTKLYKELLPVIRSYFDQHLKSGDQIDLTEQFAGRDDIAIEPLSIVPDTATLESIQGRIIDEDTKLVIPYVNIGIPHRNLGTVSDKNGDFSLDIRSFDNDTLRISCIGYHPITIPLKQWTKKLLITLAPQKGQLNEVVIDGKPLKKKIIGNKTESKFISTPFGYKQLGAEMGVKIPIKNKPTYLEVFNFNVPFNRLSGKAIFRLNIYNIKDDKPFQNILEENILIPLEPKQTGKISTSLKPYHILLNDDVIVSLEWVGYEGELKKGEGINFSLGFFNHGTYVRYASQSEMEKKFGMGVGFNLEVSY